MMESPGSLSFAFGITSAIAGGAATIALNFEAFGKPYSQVTVMLTAAVLIGVTIFCAIGAIAALLEKEE